MHTRQPMPNPARAVHVSAILGSALPSLATTRRQPLRRVYLKSLVVAFTLLNSCRILAYLPTLLAIYSTGNSSQHSLWTWCIWCGSNLTTAAWLYEKEGCRMNRVAAVSLGNALMCAIAVALILAYRF